MDEPHVLSSEEVDAILKVTKESKQDIGIPVDNTIQLGEHNYTLSNISELTKVECEKIFTSFLRKKILAKANPINAGQLSSHLKKEDKSVYSVFHIMPNDTYGMVAIDYSMLHQAINLLYGGHINKEDPVMETPGKIGIIISEKISQLCLNAFAQAFQEYSLIACDVVKTSSMFNMTSNLNLDDKMCIFEMSILFDDIDTKVKMMIPEDFLKETIQAKKGGGKSHLEKDFWRTAIKSQVVDSFVTINATLPDVSMKVKEFMDLKEGDVIPIGDPTLVYICLNNIKLFRALAAQANAKRVAKIINQI